MRVSFGNRNYIQPKPNYAKAAKSGALMTAGFLTASTAISAITRPSAMKQVVEQAGGKAAYLKTFAAGLALMSAMGAGFSALFTALSSKVLPPKNPKAAN